MAGVVIRDIVKNYLSVSAVKDLLGLNVKVRLPVPVTLRHFHDLVH